MAMALEQITRPIAKPTVELITNSRINARARCAQYEDYVYNQRLRPKKRQWALDIGSAFHLGMETLNKGFSLDQALQSALYQMDQIRDELLTDEQRAELERGKVLTEVLIRQGKKHFPPYYMAYAEQEFSIPILNPATGRPSRKFRLAGKVDGIAEMEDGSLWLIEYKTTGLSLDQYRLKYGLNNQITLYIYAMSRVIGRPISGALFRIIRKNQTKPKQKNGEIVESMEEYKERLMQIYDDEPERHVTEDLILRKPEQLARFEQELWIETQERLFQEKLSFIRRNTESCSDHGGCPFRAICLGIDGWEQQFKVSERAHMELEQVEQG